MNTDRCVDIQECAYPKESICWRLGNTDAKDNWEFHPPKTWNDAQREAYTRGYETYQSTKEIK